jgi:hypothetical protein
MMRMREKWNLAGGKSAAVVDSVWWDPEENSSEEAGRARKSRG